MFYGWVIVGVVFVSIMMTMGTWYSFSIFYVAILEEFGWSRAATAGVFTVYAVVHGLLSPVAGFAVRRWGSRVVLVAGSALMGIGLVLSSRTSAVWHLFVFYGCIVAIGGAFIGYPANSAVLSNWFQRRRGLAMGIGFAGVGVGIIVFGPLSQQLIDAYGWRTAYLGLACIALFLVLPLNLFFCRYRPADKGLTVDGLPEEAPEAAAAPGAAPRHYEWTLGSAFRSYQCWCVFGAYAFSSLMLQIVMIHQFAFLTDLGITRGVGAALISLIGIFNICGQVSGGVLCDRYGSEVAYTVSASLVVLGLGVLMLLRPGGVTAPYYIYPILFGIGSGGAGMIPVVATADIFQGPQFAAVAGSNSLGWGLGGGIGPLLAGWIFDVTNSYQIAFVIAMFVSAAGAATIWIAAPRIFRRRLHEAATVQASAAGAPS